MQIKYIYADDIKERAEDIIKILEWKHIDLDNISYIRSYGSVSKYTIARCHALGKAMQIGMKRKTSFYLIEVLSEKFDKLSEDEKIKVVIHELMHIPKTFGGGFIQHDKVNDKNVNKIYKEYFDKKYNKIFIDDRYDGAKEWH
jgi:predicted metallopeptidase